VERDRYREIDQSLKLAMLACALVALSVYMIRLNLADAKADYELQRKRAAKAEGDLDGALAKIHELQKHGDEQPAG
jgi:hypothetical protein